MPSSAGQAVLIRKRAPGNYVIVCAQLPAISLEQARLAAAPGNKTLAIFCVLVLSRRLEAVAQPRAALCRRQIALFLA